MNIQKPTQVWAESFYRLRKNMGKSTYNVERSVYVGDQELMNHPKKGFVSIGVLDYKVLKLRIIKKPSEAQHILKLCFKRRLKGLCLEHTLNLS